MNPDIDPNIFVFNESDYLFANPDVAAAVASGQFSSGLAHYQEFGKQEGRAWGTQSRIGKVFFALNKAGAGLEIGPCHNPIAPKKYGFNVQILDHLNTAGLLEKYSGHGIDTSRIEEVDFVWNGEELTDLLEKKSCYDWIIASHVIEHIPDLLSFLQQCEALLKPEGKLSLVIPDKRYCFDYLNVTSSTGQFLDAHQQRLTRPSPGQIFDHFANASIREGKIAWDNQADGKLDLVHTFTETRNAWLRARSGMHEFSWQIVINRINRILWMASKIGINYFSKKCSGHSKLHLWLQKAKRKIKFLLLEGNHNKQDYIDVHCWKFTPDSFRLVLSDLSLLGLTHMSIIQEFGTTGCEFYVTLGKGPLKAEDQGRLTILQQVISSHLPA